MREMLRTWLRVALFLVGVGVSISGFDELVLTSEASREPVPAELAGLEHGAPLLDHHLRIGPHLAVFSRQLVTYLKAIAGKRPRPATRILAVYYPIVSPVHPYARGKADEPGRFAVLVKDSTYERLGEVPERDRLEDSMDGLVVTDTTRWRDDQKKRLAKLFPGIDLDRVIVFEKGREPESIAAGIRRTALGLSLLLLALFGPALLRRLRGSNAS